MVTTLGRLDPMITWLHEVTWLIKNDISPLPRGPWLPNVTRWKFIVRDTIHYIFWRFDYVIKLSRDRWKTLYLNFCETNGYQTWQSGEFQCGLIIHEVTQSVDHEVTWQTKNVLNSLSRDLLLSNMTEGWLIIKSHMSNHSARYSFDHVFTSVHVTNELCYIFTSTRPISTKLNRMMACNEELPLTK